MLCEISALHPHTENHLSLGIPLEGSTSRPSSSGCGREQGSIVSDFLTGLILLSWWLHLNLQNTVSIGKSVKQNSENARGNTTSPSSREEIGLCWRPQKFIPSLLPPSERWQSLLMIEKFNAKAHTIPKHVISGWMSFCLGLEFMYMELHTESALL